MELVKKVREKVAEHHELVIAVLVVLLVVEHM